MGFQGCRSGLDLDRQTIQRFIGEVDWDHGPPVDELARQVAAAIGRPDTVLVFDPSAFPKKGTASVGVHEDLAPAGLPADNSA